MSKRDAYVETLKARIDEWNADIAKLEARAKEAEASGRAEYHEQLNELRERRDEGLEQMKKAQESGDAAWDDMHAGFEAAWESISNAFQNAMRRFR
jgi:chromosome segregation ATPase